MGQLKQPLKSKVAETGNQYSHLVHTRASRLWILLSKTLYEKMGYLEKIRPIASA